MKKLNVKSNFTKSNQNGITLIALIVTIIVLIIIAGISIATLTADNGVLRQTNLAKVQQMEANAREQVSLACAAMRVAIAEAHAKDNSYSAVDNVSLIEIKLESILQADKQGLNGNFNGTVNSDKTIKIEYVGDDYKQACNDNDAIITYTITLEQKSIEITDESNSTLLDSNKNSVEIDIGADSQENPGESGGANTEIQAGLYESGSNYTTSSKKTWSELITEGIIHVNSGVLSTNPEIGDGSNGSNSDLVGDLVISNEVTSLAQYAFYKCDNLTQIVIPETVTSIVNNAFYGCTGLTSISIPNGVTVINGMTFAYCQSLASITLPGSITSIGSGAFQMCTNLSTINFEGTMAQWNAITLQDNWNSGCSATTVTCLDGTITL